MLLAGGLASRDHEVQSVDRAEAALKLLHAGERFEILVVDWMLPGMSGLELTRIARRMSSRWQAMTILVVTARDSTEGLRHVLDAGASDFLQKPFRLQELQIRLAVAEQAVMEQQSRIRAERELARTKAEMESIFNALPIGVVQTDTELRVRRANPAFIEITRCSTLPTGVPLGRFVMDPSWSDRHLGSLRGKDKPHPEEQRFHRADGTTFVAETVSSTVVGEDGEPESFICAVTDVTLRAEMHERLRMTDRLAQIGTLASGVSHEINNPLTSILGNLSFLEGELLTLDPADADPMIRELRVTVSDAQQGCDRVRQIVHKLRTFARADESTMSTVSVNELLEETTQLMAATLRSRCELNFDFEPVPVVQANPSTLGQVFLNLLRNAAEASPRGRRGAVAVRTRMDRDLVVVEVEDEGPGIPEDVRARMFDPFFTTKAGTKATGLGLATSQSIVTALGGAIVCETTLGKGTLFRVSLPPAPRP